MGALSLKLQDWAAEEARNRYAREGQRAVDRALEEYDSLPAGDRRRPLLNRVISHLSFPDALAS